MSISEAISCADDGGHCSHGHGTKIPGPDICWLL